MSFVRRQIQIDAPVAAVWGLLADVNHHPDWWPRVIAVECEGVEQGCTYRRVFQKPKGFGIDDTTFTIDELTDCESLRIRCLDSGSFAQFRLAESQGGTFVDAEAGMEPINGRDRTIDRFTGKRFFGRWMDQSLEALRDAACEKATASRGADA